MLDYTSPILKEMALVLREEQVPFFSQEELQFYLDKNNGKVNDAIYECLVVKSEETSLQISGMTTNDTSKYFLRLASHYRPNNSRVLKG